MIDTQSNQTNQENRDSEKSDTVFLTLHQAAKMTGYHQDYLGQMARSGKLEARKVGRNWQTTKLAINKMLGRVPEEEPVVESKITSQNWIPNISEQQDSLPQKIQEEVPQLVKATGSVIRIVSKHEPEQISTSELLEPDLNSVGTPQTELKVARLQSQEVEFETPVITQPQKIKFNNPVLIRRLINSPDAGPNLQEALAFETVSPLTAASIKGVENQNTFLRLSKLNKNQAWSKSAHVTVPEKYSRAKKLSDKILNEQSSIWSTRALIFASVVFFAAVGYASWLTYGSGTSSVSNFVDPNLVSADLNDDIPDKMVAGESTTAEQLRLNRGPGQAVVFAGKDQVVVNHPGTEPNSTILLTFKNDYGGRYWIADQRAGQFTVQLSGVVNEDIKFDYWVIDSEQRDPP